MNYYCYEAAYRDYIYIYFRFLLFGFLVIYFAVIVFLGAWLLSTDENLLTNALGWILIGLMLLGVGIWLICFFKRSRPSSFS